MKRALLIATLIGTLGVSSIVGYASSTLDGKGAQDVQVVANRLTENVSTTLEDAKRSALEKVNGHVIGMDASDDTHDEFDIQLDDSVSEVKVDKASGAVTEVELEYERPVTAKISQQQATEIAQKEVSNGEIVKLVLENDDGLTVYDIEIVKKTMEYELKIDASTGEILEYEQDDVD